MGLRLPVRDPVVTDEQTPPRLRAEALAYVGLGAALAAVVILSSRGSFTPDIKPEVYLNPLRRLLYDLSAWQPDPQLGVGNYNNGLAPVSALTSALHAVGLPPEIIVRLLRLALLGIGAAGSVRLYRAVSGAADVPVGRVTVAAVYLFNPYAVVGGATLAVLLPYALLPWLLLALLRGLHAGRGWRWPAVFALVFFAMSGMNVAAVPVLQLVAVPAVLVHVRLTTGRSWTSALAVLARCAVLCLLVSVYWLLPAAVAYGWGSTVAGGSETVAGISNPSSFAEVLRGLGLWPMYGRNVVTGPWTPGFTSYLVNGAVIAASFLLVAVAAFSARATRSRGRVLAVVMLACTAVVMVGVHPPASPSAFGRLLGWLLENVPGAVALRTTNKAGGGLALALAILVALGAVHLSRVLGTHGMRLAATAAVGAVVVGAAWPAFAGTSYVGRWQIPGYWNAAASNLDEDRNDARVWFLPGQVLAHYRWNTEGPDDVNLALLDRPSLLRTVLPVTSAESTNLLAGVDTALQEGRLTGRSISTLARYLGVDQVLLRNDTVWEDARGGRPAVVQPQVDGDPGLTLAEVYGRPGENTGTVVPGVDAEADGYERLVEPLRRYQVQDPRGIVRAESPNGTVLVDGDGFSLPALIGTGLLADGQTFRYTGNLTPDELRALLGPGSRIVLTDSNRRRAADEHHLTNAYGPLLAADADAPSTRALYGPEDQTVARYDGIAGVSATEFGSPFDVSPRGAPDLAVDGDPTTQWTFGAFGTATSQSLTIRLVRPHDLGTVTVRTGPQFGPVRITSLRLEAGGQERVVSVDASGTARFQLAGVTADSLQLSVASTYGDGYNLVGIAEVTIPGISVQKVARLPIDLQAHESQLDAQGRVALASTPLDVVLERARGPRGGVDEEPSLERDLALPGGRDFRTYGLVRTSAAVAAPSGTGACVTVATVDGSPLRVRLLEAGASADHAVLVAGCTPLHLGAGEHQVRSVPGWTVDLMVLRDSRGESVTQPGPVPEVGVLTRTPTAITARAAPAAQPYLLVAGQSMDPGWRAQMDGRDLGTPVLVDGYSAAWPIDDLSAHTFTLVYEPQRVVVGSRLISAATLVMLAILVLRPSRSRDLPTPSHRSVPAQPASRGTAAAVTIAVLVPLVGGWWLLPVGLALGAAHRWHRPRPRAVIACSAVLFLLVPVAWIVGNLGRWGEITPALVTDNPWPHWIAAAALACLVVGVLDDDRDVTEQAAGADR